MKSRYRRYCIQPPLLCLMPAACAAGCSGKYFKHVQPKNKSTEIPFISAFSWEAKQPVADLQFELYRGTGPKEPFVEAFRFRTRKDYYRPD